MDQLSFNMRKFKPTIQRLTEAIGNFAPALDQTVARQQGTEGNNVKVMSGLVF